MVQVARSTVVKRLRSAITWLTPSKVVRTIIPLAKMHLRQQAREAGPSDSVVLDDLQKSEKIPFNEKNVKVLKPEMDWSWMPPHRSTYAPTRNVVALCHGKRPFQLLMKRIMGI